MSKRPALKMSDHSYLNTLLHHRFQKKKEVKPKHITTVPMMKLVAVTVVVAGIKVVLVVEGVMKVMVGGSDVARVVG